MCPRASCAGEASTSAAMAKSDWAACCSVSLCAARIRLAYCSNHDAGAPPCPEPPARPARRSTKHRYESSGHSFRGRNHATFRSVVSGSQGRPPAAYPEGSERRAGPWQSLRRRSASLSNRSRSSGTPESRSSARHWVSRATIISFAVSALPSFRASSTPGLAYIASATSSTGNPALHQLPQSAQQRGNLIRRSVAAKFRHQD